MVSEGYREYSPHYPSGTAPEGDSVYCLATHETIDMQGYFTCTLQPSHEGRHEAGIGDGLIAASWPRETATVTMTNVREEG